MSGVLLGLAIAFNAIALVVGVRYPLKARQFAPFSWLVLAGLGIAVFTTTIDGLALAACAGMMAFAGGIAVRSDATGVVRSAALALALMTPLGLWGDVVWLHTYHATLSVGIAGALAAAVVGWTNIVASRVLPLVGVGAAAGAMTIGYARGAQIGTGYHLPLRDGSSSIYWELTPMERLPEGLRILASGPVPDWMVGSMFALVSTGVLLAVLWVKPRARVLIAAAGAILGGTILYGLATIRVGSGQGGLPPAEPYMEVTRQLLLSRGLGESALSQAQFGATSGALIDVQSMIPELILWFVAPVCFLLALRTDDTKIDVATMERAAAVGWVAWFLTLVFQINLYGVPGIHSASEWTMLGCVLIGSGAALAASLKGQLGQRVRSFAPPLVVVVWLISLAVSWVFRAPLGLSLTL